MPQSLHYPIITILLLGSRAHQRRYIYNSLPLFRRTLLLPTGAIPLTALVRQNIYNVWLSLINLSTADSRTSLGRPRAFAGATV